MRFRWSRSPATDPETQIDRSVPVEPSPPIRATADEAQWTISFGPNVFALRDGINVIGRRPGVAVPLDSPVVSREHARVIIHDGRAFLEDLGSKNGTFIRERRVDSRIELQDTAAIRLGSIWLFCRAPAAKW